MKKKSSLIGESSEIRRLSLVRANTVKSYWTFYKEEEINSKTVKGVNPHVVGNAILV